MSLYNITKTFELNYEGFEQYLIMKRQGKDYGYYNHNVLYAFNFGGGYGAIVFTDKKNNRLWTLVPIKSNITHYGSADADLVYYWLGESNPDDYIDHLTGEDVLNYLKEIERRKNDERLCSKTKTTS